MKAQKKRADGEALRKLERQGVEARRYDPPLSDQLLAELKTVSDEWLEIPGRRERQFTLGRFEPDYIRGSPVLVAATTDGRVQAFVNIIRLPGKAKPRSI